MLLKACARTGGKPIDQYLDVTYVRYPNGDFGLSVADYIVEAATSFGLMDGKHTCRFTLAATKPIAPFWDDERVVPSSEFDCLALFGVFQWIVRFASRLTMTSRPSAPMSDASYLKSSGSLCRPLHWLKTTLRVDID